MPVTGPLAHPLRAAAGLAYEVTCGVSAATHLVRMSAGRPVSPDPGQLRPGIRPEPVLLVHGLGSNSSCFGKMEGYLHAQGYTVYALNYSCFGADIAACGRDLAREAAWLRHQTGSESVSVVAHSLGGMVVRWSIAHTWMGDWVNLVVTLGTPHRGTPTARLAPSSLPGFGKIISQLRPGAGADDDALPERPGIDTRWVAVAGEHDWVVPPRCAHLPASPRVRNVTVPGGGHLTLPNSGYCLQLVLEELAAAERQHRASGPCSAAISPEDASPLSA